MNDRDLREALHDLPAIRPDTRFTHEVLDRLDVADPDFHPRRPPARGIWPLAASALLALSLGVFLAAEKRTAVAATEGVRTLQAESARLRNEIQELEARLRRDDSLLYVGGTEEVDLVLDLSRWARSPENAAGGGSPL